MTGINSNQQYERLVKFRQSTCAQWLSNSQFDETMAITGIIRRQILKTGKYEEKLSDYAHAFSRSEKCDPIEATKTIHFLFKARHGQSMEQMRETLRNRASQIFQWGVVNKHSDDITDAKEEPELQLTKEEKEQVYKAAVQIGQMVKKGKKMPFRLAHEYQVAALSQDFRITEYWAEAIIDEQFKKVNGRNLYDWGRLLDRKYYHPQIQAQKKLWTPSRANIFDIRKHLEFKRFRR